MPLLSVRDLAVRFNTPAGVVRAVDGVSLEIAAGETLGLVGESGCGKSTLGKALLRLVPASGQVMLEDQDLLALEGSALKATRPKLQMIFQDPFGSLNPRHTIGRSIGQPLRVAGRSRAEAAARVRELLAQVGLAPEQAARYPHEISGGQRQRVGIARALALKPQLVVCDEPVSALDVSVRAQIVNLLGDLQRESGIAFLFISHDLSIVEHLADRVVVMYLGQVVETAPRTRIWTQPAHPYTQALIAAAPVANPRLARARQQAPLAGELPSPLNPPAGCRFHTRCPLAAARCSSEAPALRSIGEGHSVACHFDLAPDAVLQARAAAA